MINILLSNNNFDQEYAFDTLINIIKPHMKIVCIPFACDYEWIMNEIDGELSYDGKFRNEQYKPFKEFGIEEGNFHVLLPTDTVEFNKWKLSRADIIYFSSGHMENLKYMLKSTQLWDYIIEIAEEKVIMGASAGALILQDTYFEVPHVEDKYTRIKRRTGLGLVTKQNVLVHFDMKNEAHLKNYRSVRFRTFRKKIIGLSDNSALIIINNYAIPLGDIYML